ncbi:helix-turn-helix domain-containing protein [Bacillus sp. RG28]|uniref:Helix-turn-helix domain-containing protein n=1 Tax=Gottfriedia endophytica TaxID=2820819 RepID=A0A940SJE6_9BACI|nr:helix-turn-helix transcriptional regulator [Gottfriedia endophytica]MBP0724143.1 helix-turn-helix domain-containing protein [Gottfriedia endophytica]
MINERLKILRKRKKWSLQYIADHLGIAKSTYAGYESGHRRPSLEAIHLIADLFNTSTDYLLGRVDEPTFKPKGKNIQSSQPIELTNLPCLDLTIDGETLSDEEMQQFIAFIRAKRELEKQTL